jgi:hypothetical protein
MSGSTRRGHPRRALFVGAALAGVGLMLWLLAAGRGPVTQRTPPAVTLVAPSTGPTSMRLFQADVTINKSAAVTSIPRSSLGLSTEYWTLPIWERDLPVIARVLSLVHVRGDRPLMVRVGGDSADHAWWETSRSEVPEWAFELTPAWLTAARRFVRQTSARLVLDLNLVTATPSIAAQWAKAAEARLPHGSILGFEIGNEPDIYSRADWLAMLPGIGSRTIGSGAGSLPLAISAVSYAQAFGLYASALSRIVPGVSLLAPALANPPENLNWISTLLAAPHSSLRAITVHRYPYSECALPGTSTYPTIERILSENATAGMARTVRAAVALAHRSGLPLKVTELNSVTCGGRAGVSNTFATALWAPDALFELLRAGVNAVNVHVREFAINAAFVLNGHGLIAHPLLYGLLAFSRMLGPEAKLVPLRLHSRRSMHLKAWAVSVRGNMLHVLVIDKGEHAVRVLLHLQGEGVAAVQRMLSPAVTSRSGVTLAGQRIATDGSWRGASLTEHIRPGPQGYQLIIPRLSAALVAVHLRPTTPGRTKTHLQSAARGRRPTQKR